MVDHSILKVEVDIYRFIYMPVVARTVSGRKLINISTFYKVFFNGKPF